MPRGSAKYSRKPAQQLHGTQPERIRKYVPGAKFQVDLTAERREELTHLLHFFIDSIPGKEREHLVNHVSTNDLRDMLRRGSTNLNPNHLSVGRTVAEIWRDITKYDLFLIHELVRPFSRCLEDGFDEKTISNPSAEEFKAITHYLGRMWSRAAVYSVITHLALSPMPAQEFALDFVAEIEKSRESNSEFDQRLDEIEFTSEAVVLDPGDQEPTQFAASNETQTVAAEKTSSEIQEAQILDSELKQIDIADESAEERLTPTQSVSQTPVDVEVVDAESKHDQPTREIQDEYSPVQPKVELASIDEIIFTPLGRMLITQAVASADGDQIGALSREEYAEMLRELTTLNNAHMPTWFQIGFSSALGLVEPDFKMDSAALNSTRKYWHLWGLIKGLVRIGDQDQLEQICDQQWSEVFEMFKSGLASEMLVDVARIAIYQNIEKAEQLLGNFSQIPAASAGHEMALLQMLDSESVVMLRNSEANRAIRVLEIAQHRLVHLNSRDRLTGYEKSQITDLHFRLLMGIAACYRATNDFESAITALELPEDFPIEQINPRTATRLYIQQFLSASKAKRIEDVELPRNKSERKAFNRHYLEHSQYLHKALEIYGNNPDANYLLAGIRLSEGNFDEAEPLLGRAILYYGNRDDRAAIKPKILLLQSLLKARNGDLIDLEQAIDEIIDLAPRLQKEEFLEITKHAIELQSGKIGGFVSWSVQENIESTLSLTSLDLAEVLKLAPTTFDDLVALSSRLPKVAERIASSILLLEDALSRQKDADIESALSQIDDLRNGHSPVVHKQWAEFCFTNDDFREYINPFEANLSGLVSLGELDDKDALVERLIQILDSMLNVETFEEEGNFQQLLKHLREVAPEYSEIYGDDPRTKAPHTYTGWVQSIAASSATEKSPIRVFFVGGNPERQSIINEGIKPEITALFGSQVEVEFFESTWLSTWNKVLNRIEQNLDRADVVVLSPLVRTTFGQTLRRKLNDLHIPRIACTSEGKSSTIRSIKEAVRVAERLRTKS